MKINIALAICAISSLSLLACRWWSWRNEWVEVQLPLTFPAQQTIIVQDEGGLRTLPIHATLPGRKGSMFVRRKHLPAIGR